ncbi:uncharacterized protein Gasu_11090 [Galdieria sulphuraria]|uniref:BZIP domain-containing protein n=1 Tax=Galdieria sulphuraria TaxID=130081 RepID=M2Y6R9_GALSU|nr:uncharacterized protein Gasu_11090 [Galdieria sulphuraria]EME31733.1 hypothetical protein Gasu_11090 [Galdieria sulphuraria]|eukprot:XP_005708253.1 hypothetical protein Gasu_11090 [Galdieria sulphuraria]
MTALLGTTGIPRRKQNYTEFESEKQPGYSSSAGPSIPLITQSPSSQATPGRGRSPYEQLQVTAEEPYAEASHRTSAYSKTRQLPLLPDLGISSSKGYSVSLSTNDQEEKAIKNKGANKRSYPFPIFHEQKFENKSHREQRHVTSPVDKHEEYEPEMTYSHYSETRIPALRTTQAEASSESRTELQPSVLSSRLHRRYEEEEEEEEEESSQSKGKKNLSEEERKTLKILRNRLSAEKSRLRQRQRMTEMAKQIQEYEEVLNTIRSEANALLRYVERLEAFCRLTGIPDSELRRPILKFLPP